MSICPLGHTTPRGANGRCMECNRIYSKNYYYTEAGRRNSARQSGKKSIKEAKKAGINGDIRRKIENRAADKELEDLINV